MNLSALNNLPPFVVNNSLINDTPTMATSIVTNANVTTEGFFGLGIMLVIFIFMMIVTTTQQDIMRLNFLQSFILSSGIVTILGILGLVGNLFSSFQHVMWFAILFLCGLVANYLRGK